MSLTVWSVMGIAQILHKHCNEQICNGEKQLLKEGEG